jgi:hypothetical protein
MTWRAISTGLIARHVIHHTSNPVILSHVIYYDVGGEHHRNLRTRTRGARLAQRARRARAARLPAPPPRTRKSRPRTQSPAAAVVYCWSKRVTAAWEEEVGLRVRATAEE